MARKNNSMLDDLMDIGARLPWQLSGALAVVAYLVLHSYATRAPLPADPAVLKSTGTVIGEMVAHTLWTSAASVLQYVIPLGLGIGAVSSFFRRQRQRRLVDEVRADLSGNALEKMSWLEFEGLAAETFRQRGYDVVERGGDGPDGGVDLELRMGTDKYLVQCKQWKTTRVGVATVRELYGVMAAERAVGGFVVASGDFTRDARNFAEGRSIVLVDARKLNAMIVPARPPSAPQPVSTLPPAPREPTLSPVCPKCGGAMVQRTARQGVHAGKPFWGCVHYPACMGVRFK